MARPIAVLFAAAAAVVLCSVLALTLGSHRPHSPPLLSVKMIHGDTAVRASSYATREQNANGSSQATNSSMLSCGNGLTCAAGQTCTSTQQGAGARRACSPQADAVICADKRFSCPAGSTCQKEQCTPSNGGASVSASTALDAVSVEMRTYGNGVYISPTDPPGTAGDLGSDICNALAPSLPGLCTCSSSPNGANVSCPISFISHIFSSLEVSALFVPCASAGPRIQYEYSVSGGSQRESEIHPAATPINPRPGYTYHQRRTFLDASLTYLQNGKYLAAGFMSAFNKQTIDASLSIDICQVVPGPWGGEYCSNSIPEISRDLETTCTIPPHSRHVRLSFYVVMTCPFPFASACTSHVAFINSCLNRVPQTRPLSCFFGRLLRLRPHLRQQLSFPQKLERQWRLRVTCRHHLSQPTARIFAAAAGIDACGPSPMLRATPTAVDWEMLTCEG